MVIEKYKKLPKPAKASLWFLICSFLQKGISTITTPIFTRLLSTAEYGNYSVFNSWLGIVSIIVTLDLFAGVYTQGIVKFDDKRNQFSSALQGLTLALTVGWTIIYLVEKSFWNELLGLSTVQMLAMLVLVWTSAAFRFWAAYERVTYSYVKLVLLTIVVSIAKPVVGIYFVTKAQDKVTARILGLALVEVVCYAGLFFVQVRRERKLFDAKFWKYALLFNLPLVPHYLSQIVLNNSDRLMINSIVGADAAGIYSLAYSLSQIMTLFSTALLQTIEPWIYQKIKAKKIHDIPRIAYLSLAAIAFINLVLIVFAPEAVRIFAPQAYFDAIWVIPPVAMSVYFMYSYSLFANFEFYFEKRSFIMSASILGAALNVGLNYIFIPIYGYYAAGYTTLVCYIIYAIGHYVFMQKVLKEELNITKLYSLKVLLAISIGFLGLGFGIMATYQFPLVRYSIIALLGVIAILKRKVVMNVIRTFLAIRK